MTGLNGQWSMVHPAGRPTGAPVSTIGSIIVRPVAGRHKKNSWCWWLLNVIVAASAAVLLTECAADPSSVGQHHPADEFAGRLAQGQQQQQQQHSELRWSNWTNIFLFFLFFPSYCRRSFPYFVPPLSQLFLFELARNNCASSSTVAAADCCCRLKVNEMLH